MTYIYYQVKGSITLNPSHAVIRITVNASAAGFICKKNSPSSAGKKIGVSHTANILISECL